MLHILLLILKIIGIILLCILGMLVLGILCALFVPVRYRIEAVRKEGEGEPPVELRVKVTWLLHLINFLFRFDGSLFLQVRLALFTVFKLPKQEKQGKWAKQGHIGKKKRKHKQKQKKASEPEDKDISGEDSGETPEKRQEKVTTPDNQDTLTSGENREEDQERDGTEGDASDKRSFLEKLRAIPAILRDIFTKIKSLFTNIRYTIQKFCDKIRSVSEKTAYYREIVEGEPFQRSFALCKNELIAIGKILKPDQFEAQFIVGLGDPAATGEVLAVCGMLYPLFAGHVDVDGDFEKKRLEGRVFIKGRLRFFTFLRVAVRIYFNKDIKKLIRILKKEAV